MKNKMKIIVLGDEQVGKTTLFWKLTNQNNSY